jgi:formylglycine-generating enzyme required for sulfatase activity
MAGKIFISYRRDDAPGSAALVAEHLSRVFGAPSVFMDVDNILAGQRFEQELRTALAACDVFLAVIGPRWLDLLKAKRVARDRDYVREEIAAALARGVVVIPVTVERAGLPHQKELPSEIAALVSHQKHTISQEHRSRDLDDLITAIKATRRSPEIITTLPWNWIAMGGAATLLVVAAIGLFLSGSGGPTQVSNLSQAAAIGPDTTASTASPKVAVRLAATVSDGSFRDNLANGEPCPKCPEMVAVRPGKFTMGSPEDEFGRTPGQENQIQVNVAHAFAVAKYPVTFDEWDACVADRGCPSPAPEDQGWGRGRRPVINVSWDDVKWYIAWLKAKTGKPYRLLSEAEREYVTRAGSSSPFWWGSSITSLRANYDGNIAYNGGSVGEFLRKSLPVGKFDPNPWGLYDVHGNIWEWTEDCWNTSNAGNPANGNPRLDWYVESCSRRVRRGGSWDSDPKLLRAASRAWSATDLRAPNLGFRVAQQLSP